MPRGKTSQRNSVLKRFARRRARILADVEAGRRPQTALDNLTAAYVRRATQKLTHARMRE